MTPAATLKKKPEIPDATREDIVERMNANHALLLLGDRPVVLREGIGGDGREEIRLLSLPGFHEWMRTDVVWLTKPDSDERSVKPVPSSKVWVNAPTRRQYEGLVFDPSERTPESYYNLWKGWAVEPAERGVGIEKCQRFLDHIAENVCDNDEALFAWVVGWFAQLIQQPTVKLGTSLVLRGSQGSGKSKVGNVFGSLLRDHYASVSDSRYILGRFNSHLSNCLLLQLEEAVWGGDHAAGGKLKDLVTAEYQFIEFKGREPVKVRNYIRLFMTGNNTWLVPAGLEERRFCVLDVADHKRQKNEYFRKIDEDMDNGGREALLRYLLDFDLRDVPLHTVPRTSALAEQQISSLAPEQHWWLDMLHRASLPGDVAGDGTTETGELYSSYIAHLTRMGINRKLSETAFGYALRRFVPAIYRTRLSISTPGGTRRPYAYVFPQLAECRRDYQRTMDTDASWGEDLASEWQGAEVAK